MQAGDSWPGCFKVILQGPGPCDKQVVVDLGAFRLLHEGLVQVSECCMWSTLPEKVLWLPDDGDGSGSDDGDDADGGDDDADYNDQHKDSGSGVGDDDEICLKKKMMMTMKKDTWGKL